MEKEARKKNENIRQTMWKEIIKIKNQEKKRKAINKYSIFVNEATKCRSNGIKKKDRY